MYDQICTYKLIKCGVELHSLLKYIFYWFFWSDLIKAAKKSLGSDQLPRLILYNKEKEPCSTSNTQSWETREMHAFF